jgi:hypothetical protein
VSILRKDQQQNQIPSETSDRREARILRGFHEKSVATYLHPNAILHEVQQLYSVSDRFDSLAEQHPSVSEALLEVLVATKNSAALRIRSGKCLICSSLSA